MDHPYVDHNSVQNYIFKKFTDGGNQTDWLRASAGFLSSFKIDTTLALFLLWGKYAN